MISAKIGLILSFSLILIWGARLPVVRRSIIGSSFIIHTVHPGTRRSHCRTIRKAEEQPNRENWRQVSFKFSVWISQTHHNGTLSELLHQRRQCQRVRFHSSTPRVFSTFSSLDPNDRTPDPERLLRCATIPFLAFPCLIRPAAPISIPPPRLTTFGVS